MIYVNVLEIFKMADFFNSIKMLVQCMTFTRIYGAKKNIIQSFRLFFHFVELESFLESSYLISLLEKLYHNTTETLSCDIDNQKCHSCTSTI
jgi:hypothetical protein